MKNFIYFFLCLLAVSAKAQLSEGGIPYGLANHIPYKGVYQKLNDIDILKAQNEDRINDLNKNVPYRFGIKIPTQFDLKTLDNWTTLPNGDRLWQFGIECTGAFSLNFIFDNFYIPKGSKLYIYNADTKECLGAFTNLNNNAGNTLATTLILSNKVIVEYFEPLTCKNQGSFIISEVVYGYRNFLKDAKTGFGQSGGCQINVNCALGFDWYNEKRSVVLIMVNNNAICTGTLLNDVPQDTMPYILTANHCGNASANTVFVFNYESPSCSNVNASLTQSIQGGTTVASNVISDFNLVLLSAKVPASYNAYYAGWNRSKIAPDSVVGIHHPNGDIKKISFAYNTCTDSGYLGTKCWKIFNWSLGCTEPASSGSPLFNKAHQVVGQLLGGPSYCGAAPIDMNDYYGMFAVSWDSGSVIVDRAKEWLDPNNTDTMAINGFDPFFVTPTYFVDAALIRFDKPLTNQFFCNDSIMAQIIIKNVGLVPLTQIELLYSLDGNASQSITYPLNVPTYFSAALNLPAILIPNTGLHSLVVWINNVNGVTDGNMLNNRDTLLFFHKNTVSVTLSLQTDNWGSETTWEIKDATGHVYYAGGPYTDKVGGDTMFYNNLCLEPGCYNFIIYDNNGDGICCGGNGNGSYTLYNPSAVALFTGGQFTTSSTHSFCLDSESTSGVNPFATTTIFPNPSSDFVRINLNELDINRSLKLFNVQGGLVFNTLASTKNMVVDITSLPAGVYMVKYNNITIGRFTKIKNSF